MRSGDVVLSARCAGEPGRSAVVLVHGYPDTKTVWTPVMERLSDRFRVVAYDVRGAGSSSAPRGLAAYRMERLADDFDAVSRAVSPDAPVHLVGHDWGGIQAWEFACDARFAGRIASFTTIAGPALGHAVDAGRAAVRGRRPLRALGRARRSWYILPLCLPGGPTVMWRLALAGSRWRRWLTMVEGVPVDAEYPAATSIADGLHGANLYRANIPHRLLGRNTLARALVPVQLVIPARDRFISRSYYDAADEVAPGLVRRTVAGSHWAPRAQPDLVAEWIAEFALGVEDGSRVGPET